MRKCIYIQHLVRLRWEELSPAEHKNFANLSLELMSEIADPCENWSLKSQTAALVAEVFIARHFLFIIFASYSVTIADLLYIDHILWWFFHRLLEERTLVCGKKCFHL